MGRRAARRELVERALSPPLCCAGLVKPILFAVFIRHTCHVYGHSSKENGSLGLPHTDLANPIHARRLRRGSQS